MSERPSWSVAFAKALLLHGLLLTVLFLQLDGAPPKPQVRAKPVEVVQAVAVDETKVEAEIQRLKAREEARRQEEQARQKELEQARLREEQRLKELKRKQQEEQQHLKDLAEAKRRQVEEEARRLKELEQRQREEKEHLAKLEQARIEAERQRQQEEARRKAAEEARRKAEEAKRKAEEEARRKAEEARRKAEEEARRKAEEENRLQAELDRRQQINAAMLRIQQRVERNWLRPQSYHSGLSCIIQVRLAPGGKVIEARVVRSSGNVAFDRSAEVAVYKASPLPVPGDPAVFATFQEFNFLFKPQG